MFALYIFIFIFILLNDNIKIMQILKAILEYKF